MPSEQRYEAVVDAIVEQRITERPSVRRGIELSL
jgi:hypothetical protein